MPRRVPGGGDDDGLIVVGGGELRRKRVPDDVLHVLEPRPVARGDASAAHPVPLELVPLLQVIHLVLALLHALRLVLAPLRDNRRHLLPVPPPQVPPIQLRELLRVRVQQAHDSRVAPLLSVLPVLAGAGAGAGAASGAGRRLRSLCETVRRRRCVVVVADLVAIFSLFGGVGVVVIEGIAVVFGVGVGDGFRLDGGGSGDGGGEVVVVVRRRVGLVEEREIVVVVVARGH